MRRPAVRALLAAPLLILSAPALAHPVHAAPGPHPAPFRVGTAVEDVNPPPGVPLYSGGFGASPGITATYAPLQVRAIYVSNGRHAVAMAVVDSQAWFAAYQEGPDYGITYVRQQAAAQISAAEDEGPAMSQADIIVQGTHSHSAPTGEGIWGPVPVPYLQEMTQQTIAALAGAAASARPATLEWATIAAPDLDNVVTAQTDSYAGWTQDGQVSVLRALDPSSGATVATFANVPAHPDIVDGASLQQLGADYFGDVRDSLQALLGGTAVVGPATLGREESFVQVGGLDQMHWYAKVVTNRITEALSHAHPVTDSTIAASELPVAVPGTNPLLLGLVAANHLPDAQKQQLFTQTGEYPIDRADTPPYLTGPVIGTYVTALRIGGVAYVSMPGESFPEVRSAIAASTRGAGMIVALNKGQDDWGYYFPAWATPFTEVYHSDHLEYNVSPVAGDAIIQTQLLNLGNDGFTTQPGIPAPLQTDWEQAIRPGLQSLAAPGSGDAGPGGTFTTVVQAAFSSAAYNGSALSGRVHWDFGDGTSADSQAVRDGSGAGPQQTQFPHTFTVGSWTVTLNATDTAGNAATWSMPVTVHPALQPSISAQPRRGGSWRFTAGISGGDGALLAGHWRFGDGGTADGITVTHTFAPGSATTATLVAVDGTASCATAAWSAATATPSPTPLPTPGGGHHGGTAADGAPAAPAPSAVPGPATRSVDAVVGGGTPWPAGALAGGTLLATAVHRRRSAARRRRG